MILFTPGPANISERVRAALLHPDIGHREREFSDLLAEIRRHLLEVCGVGAAYRSVVFSGSGTLAIESALAALSGWGKKVLVLANGVYGERATDICRVHDTPLEEMRTPWGEVPDLGRVEETLRWDGVGAVYVVHHETTTGLLNPLPEIAAMARTRGKMVLVDGVSSIAGERLDLDAWGIDMISGSANKCLRGVPGASFVLASHRFLGEAERCKPSSRYADLLGHLKAEERGETPFTPAVQVFYALREALRETLEEGVGARINRYRSIASTLREGLRSLGLKLLLPESLLSNTMTCVRLPKGLGYESLHHACRERGYVIYASQGELAKTTFRLGTVGPIREKDIAGFLAALRVIAQKRGMNG